MSCPLYWYKIQRELKSNPHYDTLPMLDADTDFYFIAKHTADKNGPLQNLK